jgi:hypothetical protein
MSPASSSILPPMHRLTGLLLALALLLLGPVGVGANGGDAFVHVPEDHITAGAEFPVIGANMEPGSEIRLFLANGPRRVSLGTVTTDQGGAFQTTAAAPADFPDGYAQIVAISDIEEPIWTLVLVGPRETYVMDPGGTSLERLLSDPLVLILVVAVVGSIVVLALLWRSSRRAQTSGRRPQGP